MGFDQEWPKLKQDKFGTFRFTRQDKDWELWELVQIVIKPRSPKRKYLGIARIIWREVRVMPAFNGGSTSNIWTVTEKEAVADGFSCLDAMERWFNQAHGKDRVENEHLNKLTLRWEDKVLSP